jgi:hypothetical protein
MWPGTESNRRHKTKYKKDSEKKSLDFQAFFILGWSPSATVCQLKLPQNRNVFFFCCGDQLNRRRLHHRGS